MHFINCSWKAPLNLTCIAKKIHNQVIVIKLELDHLVNLVARDLVDHQGQTGRVFQLRVGSGSGIEKIFRVGSGRVGYRVFVSNTKSTGYYGVLKS